MKVSELEGAWLDYFVAKAEGHEWRCSWMLEKDGMQSWQNYECAWGNPTPLYSTQWSEGGRIIERERPAIEPCWGEKGWYVRSKHAPCDGDQFYGDTLLIAAMRAYVASKFGDEVNSPQTYQQEK